MNNVPRFDRRGYLMPIGGAEDKKKACAVLARFMEISGGRDARIVVVPAASQFPDDLGKTYDSIFRRLGVTDVNVLHIRSRTHGNDVSFARILDNATGIFFTGGDQLRLLSYIGNTRFSRALLAASQRGVHIAGTSAGASAMSATMIGFGRSGSAPSQRMVQLAHGLGLTNDLIIDQHFSQRQRLGRLTTAVALCPGLVGVGIDEDTALLIAPDGCTEVVGSGTVTVIDGAGMEYSSHAEAKRHNAFDVRGLDPITLRSGDSYLLPLPANAITFEQVPAF